MPKKGSLVVVHYRGTTLDGREFDSSEGREPLQFVVGSGAMIRGFEKAVLSMNPGETKTVKIKASEAYGPVRRELIMEVPKDRLPPGLTPSPGDRLKLKNPRGETVEVRVIKATENSITVDANHELAGKDLIFTIKLIAVRK